MTKLKVGQIGIGHNHGSEKMKALRKFTSLFEVVGFAEENEVWIEKRGGMAVYQDVPRLTVDEIIARSDVVAVECDVWNLNRYAKLCIDAGKPIHLDKPYNGSLAEYKALLDDAKAKNLVVQLGYMYRYNPAVQYVFDLVKKGALGEIYSVNAEMSTFHQPAFRTWLKNFNGGIQYILGSHLVDLIVYLLGEPDKVTSFLEHTGKDGVDVEDNNLSVLEYDKALARIFVSSVEVNGCGRRQFVVAGSEGTVSILPMENPCRVTYSDRSIARKAYRDCHADIDFGNYPDPRDDRYDGMLKAFYDYVTGKAENPFTYEHEYKMQKVLDQMVGGVIMRGNTIV